MKYLTKTKYREQFDYFKNLLLYNLLLSVKSDDYKYLKPIENSNNIEIEYNKAKYVRSILFGNSAMETINLEGNPPNNQNVIQLLLHKQSARLDGFVVDESGNGNDGQMVSGPMVTRVAGHSWELPDSVLRNRGGFTVAGIVKMPDTLIDNMGVFGGNLIGDEDEILPSVRVKSTGQIQGFASIGGLLKTIQGSAGDVVGGGTYSIIITYDGSTFKLFVDDVTTPIDSEAGTGLTPNVNTFVVGGGNGASMAPAIGAAYADIRVWTRGLSESELQAYINKSEIDNTGLLSWVPCCDNSLLDLCDVSGNDNKLFVVGGPPAPNVINPNSVWGVDSQDTFFYLAMYGGSSYQYRDRTSWVPALQSSPDIDSNGNPTETSFNGIIPGLSWGNLNTVLDETEYIAGDERANPSFARILTNGHVRSFVRYNAVLTGFNLSQAIAWAGPQAHVVSKDGVWTWFSSKRALLQSDNTIIAAPITSGGDQDAVVYDIDARSRNQWQLRASTGITDEDDHNNGGLNFNALGNVLISLSRHGDDAISHVYRMTSPVSDNGDVISILDKVYAGNTTYNNDHVWSNGHICKIHRVVVSGSARWGHSTSTDNGDSFSAFSEDYTAFGFATNGSNSYSRTFMNAAGDKLWFAANDSNPSVHTCSQFLFYMDINGDKFEPDGTALGSGSIQLNDLVGTSAEVYAYDENPIADLDNGVSFGVSWIEDLIEAPNGDIVLAWCQSVLVNSIHSPNIANEIVIRDDADRMYYYTSRWNGSSHSIRFIGHGGFSPSPHTPAYSPGVAIHPDGDKFLFCSNSLDPFNRDNTPSLARGWTVNQSTLSNGSWTDKELCERTLNGEVAMRPCIASNGTDHYLLWLGGNYTYFAPAEYYQTIIKAIKL